MIAQLLQPWLITESGFQVVLGIATRREYFSAAVDRALAAREGKPLANARSVTVRDGVATIPVEGTLFRHADMMNEISGGVSYATLRLDVQRAVDAYQRGEIKGAIVSIDSPGGEANGCKEFCDALVEAAKVMPIVAYVGGLGCSAAYWIASACNEIVCSDTAILGSIGTVLGVLDNRKAQEQSGELVVEFVSSVSPNKRPDPQTDAGRAEYQARVDVLGRKFVEAVAANRGITAEAVLERYGQGGVKVGEYAVAAGLADRIGTYESLLAELASRPTPIRTGAQMNTTKMAAALGLDAAATEDQIAERVTALASFERQALGATGAKDTAEAHGVIVAAMESHRASPALRERVAQLEANEIRRELRAALEPVALGQIRTAVVDMVSAADEGKGAAIKAALAALPEKFEAGVSERDAVLAAVCSVDIGAGALRAVQSYAKHAPRASVPHREPERDPKAEAAHDAAIDESVKRIEAVGNSTRDHFRKSTNRGAAAK
jgi:ClpP class serine protease